MTEMSDREIILRMARRQVAVREKVQRVFRLYCLIESRERELINARRSGSFNIMMGNDPLAIEWQQRIAWRKEVLAAWLSNRSPNPYRKRWYMAPEARG